ncbi:efflux RND transporter permease subunit [Curvivirga sp.]|uniref:efflux RND transporter permease subunit n=1 Tax=Curvivirga sp. TaxID=2856848 RepID=UPI003B5CCC27
MMGLTEFAIRKKAVSWMVTLLIIGGGILSFLSLGRLEDPEFTIKEAVIVTEYPGASALEVEEEVTLPIEEAIQLLPYVDNIRSISAAGLSQVTVEMKGHYRKQHLGQIWDEMRRKIRDMEGGLPVGVQQPIINDDFSDVYGTFLAVTGKGYTYEDLADYVDFLRRELILVDGVGKVSIGGRLQEQIVLEVRRSKLAALELSLSDLQAVLDNQNVVSDSGRIKISSEYIRISPTGTYDEVEQLNNLLLGYTNGKIIYLSDVADVKRSYVDPATHMYRFNGESALTIGVSFAQGVNVVEVGQAVKDRMAELEFSRPIGMEIGVIYDQPSLVDESVSEFIVSLAEAVAIVMVVLLFAMGIRSGLLMSLILLLTILATFFGMKMMGVDLHRISLGALIIALGMLVDNAIVITEGILIGIKRKLTKIEAAKQIIGQTVWPLLGATVIAVTAFAPIGLSPDVSGEFTGSLFYVLLISLMISWVFAITLTPFFANLLFKEAKLDDGNDAEEIDPYKSVFYRVYRSFLHLCIRFRYVTMLAMFGAFVMGVYGFTNVNQAFFPPSNLPLITVDYWMPEGTDIRATEADMKDAEARILAHENVVKVTSTIGQGAERFMLTYSGERNYSSYGQFIIEIDDKENTVAVRSWVDEMIRTDFPQAFSKSDRFFIGPATKAKIEARISGPDEEKLRIYADRAIEIFKSNPNAINVRHDWRNRTKVLRPVFNEAEARRLGISRVDLDNALAMNMNGTQVGTLRDGSTLLPIIIRPPLEERSSIDQLDNIQVFSPVLNRYVSIHQVVYDISYEWENPLIMRRDRKRTIQIWADPDPNGPVDSFALFAQLSAELEQMQMAPGYELNWGGEYEAQGDANKAVFEFVPVGVVVMIAITMLLFNSVRQTLVVWFTVPLAIIGVASGLLIFNQPFAFTALLGFLSLSGMLLKNGIVLVEEIKRLNEEEELDLGNSILQASVSRLRPVMMAAMTTVLGLIPLLPDVFFAPLAVTIMFGLGFGTILTLVVVPVLFAIFYRVKLDKKMETGIA